MKSLDTDSSGGVSVDEFKTVGKNLPTGKFDQSDDALAKAFSSLDSDSDGTVTESEIASGLAKFSSESASAVLGQQEVGGPPPPPPPGGDGQGGGRFFTEADTDGSGTVSLDEFTAAGPKSVSSEDAENMFASIDTDGDGEISQTEDKAFRASQPQAGPPPGPPPSDDASASSDDSSSSTDTLLSQLSDLLSAKNAYSQATFSASYLDDAVSSLFSSAA